MDDKRKLSEWIREGAKLRPMIYGDFFGTYDDGERFVLGSCSLGAAFEAATGNTPDIDFFAFCEEMEDLVIAMPDEDLLDSISARNDTTDYTREQIADWLEAEGY